MKHYKVLIIALVLSLSVVVFAARRAYGPSAPAEGVDDAAALMSSQIAWNVVDETTSSGTEPSALAVTERTYLTVLAAIVADSSGDGEISWARVPPTWNGIRFRCMGITDNGTVTHQIYAGTLANGTDCELAQVGQAAWVVGTQASTVSTYEMADAVTWTADDWTATAGTANPGAEQVAEVSINWMGADIVVVVTSTSTADSKLIMKGY